MPTRRPTASRRPVGDRAKRAHTALDRIISLIFEGRLEPGARLPSERNLALQLGVSRTTLRDALTTLEARGLIDRRAKSGNFVCTAVPPGVRTPIEEVVDRRLVSLANVIELRKVLERWAAGMASVRPNRAHLATLRTCVAEMRRTVALGTEEQFDRYRAADRRFHQVIGRMTGNPLYPHVFQFFVDLIGRSLVMSRELLPGDFARGNLERHAAIFESIGARRPELAEAAMTEHFAFVERALAQARRAPVARGRRPPGS